MSSAPLSSCVLADLNPAIDVRVVVVPSWVRQHRVAARQDGKCILTVQATRRYGREVWTVLWQRQASVKGTVIAMVTLVSGRRLVADEAAEVVISVPPAMVGTIRVDVRQLGQ